MDALVAMLLIAGSWLAGSIPWGVVLGVTIKGIDPRKHGSGGTGATNSFRLLGAPIAIAVFILDFAKGLVPVLIARGLDQPDWVIGVCAVLPVIGHCWSPFIGFKGGKGMATGGGAAVGLLWWLVLILLPMIVVVAVTRYVSLASLGATIFGPIVVLAMSVWGDFPWAWSLAITALAAIIVYQHRANIQRLISGTENKFGARVATR
jgi:glycerol-3-phosphate acyltransferase PlsY